MDRQNIDRLFREKLDHLEVMPSSSAWSKVEKQIRPKKAPVIYWVAASISLLLLSWIVWPEAKSNTNFTPIASEISYPVPQQTPNFTLPEIEEKEIRKENSSKALMASQKSSAQVQLASNRLENVKKDIRESAVLENLEEKTMISEVEIETPEIQDEIIEEVKKPEFRTIKITYIASAQANKPEEIQKADSTGALKKFIAFAEKIDPGDMLADIKTAKDNLLNSGFKSKKDRNSL